MANLLDDPRLDWQLLEHFSFDRARFLRYALDIESGARTPESSRITATIEPAAGVADVLFEGPAAERRRQLGEAAIRSGAVAAVVLNGGMATRFGGVVKGVVEVDDGRSFIALKAEDARRAQARWGGRVPLVLMNSFATERDTLAHLVQNGRFGLREDDLLSFTQTIALRLNPNGSLFIGDDEKPSYYAPGHGDFFACIRKSGVLGKLLARGVKTILFSNVDNLGATIDPVIIGQHLEAGAEMTAEVTAKRRTATGEWDKGGSPARVAGKEQIVEGFRLPDDLPPAFLPDFSTNNFLFDAKAIDREIPLEWHVVKKKVDGRAALQLESISCEASALSNASGQPLLKLGLFRVPRDGASGRFFPIKEREDLAAQRGAIMARLNSAWGA